MQTTLIDPRWNMEPGTLEEAKSVIAAMLRRLQEAEKILKKPDYETADSLTKVDFSNPKKAQQQVEAVVAKIKSTPISERKTRPRSLYVVPYYHGKPKTYEMRRLSYDLTKKKQFEKYTELGTKKVTKTAYRTQFPPGLKDIKGQNCEWPVEPERLEIIESD